MAKDDATWLNICYVVAALLLVYVFWKAFWSVAVFSGWMDDYDTWFNNLSLALGIIISGFIIYRVRSVEENHEYYLASIGELRKVTWPTWIDTKKMTLIVVVVVGIFSVILAAFDFGFAWLLKKVIS